jgi:hypothetical protein
MVDDPQEREDIPLVFSSMRSQIEVHVVWYEFPGVASPAVFWIGYPRIFGLLVQAKALNCCRRFTGLLTQTTPDLPGVSRIWRLYERLAADPEERSPFVNCTCDRLFCSPDVHVFFEPVDLVRVRAAGKRSGYSYIEESKRSLENILRKNIVSIGTPQ